MTQNDIFPLFTLKELAKLDVGTKLDHRDYVGRFTYARIIDKNNTKLKIHYRSYSDKYDVWDDYKLNIQY